MLHRRAVGLAAALVLGLCGLLAPPAWAGGGPETTVVVVNGASPTSRQVANAWVRARQVPERHVIVLDGVPLNGIVSVDTFRTRLWGPVAAFLAREGLTDAVDLVVWSADFPYAVDFEVDRASSTMQPPWTRLASLTSMTYLWRHVEAKDGMAYTAADVNKYYRRAPEEVGPPRDLTDAEAALRGDAQGAIVEKRWAEALAAYERLVASLGEDAAVLYNMACCLARLARPDEAVALLTRSVAAGFADARSAREDADLAPLRGRADFDALLLRMEQAASAGVQPSRGFSSRWAWTGGADPVTRPAEGVRDRYVLSVALAYTGEWGNSVPEATAALDASARADGTDPDGTFYFLVNQDVRATTRAPRFQGAVDALRALGRKAEILEKGREGQDDQDGVLPRGKADVLGAMVGIAGFAWADAKSRIVPGAICEHLTSHGGDFAHGGQTKLSEFLRHGAAGASGTVNEPYAVQFKFPVPALHVHYVAGCSLAEAFYQSLSGPYQTYVVGDPLCRPFARFAKVTPAWPAAPWKGTVEVPVEVTAAAGTSVDRLELWVGGRPVATAAPGTALAFDTTTVEDGGHDARVVAVEAGPVATRSFAATSATVANGTAVTTLVAPKTVVLGAPLALSGRAVGATAVEVFVGGTVVAKADVRLDAWKATVPSDLLGVGTVVLAARGLRGSRPAVRSPRVEVTVTPPPPRKPAKAPAGKAAGLACVLVGKDGKARPPFALTTLGGAGQKPSVREAVGAKGPGPWTEVHLEGEVQVATAGLYQLLVTAGGTLTVLVDGKPVPTPAKLDLASPVGLAVALEAGWHDLELRYVPAAGPDLTVLLGGAQVTAPLTGAAIRQRK